MLNKPIDRNRVIYFILILIVIAVGLSSRKYQIYLPELIGKYTGDTVYALMAYFGCGFLKPKYSIWKISLLALTYSYLIEISQLYHSEWIERIRQIRLGGLILGYAFLWSDMLCYTVGVLIGVSIEFVIYQFIKVKETQNEERQIC